MKYGDLVCYKPHLTTIPHDGPIMYIGPCHHPAVIGGGSPGLIDLIGLSLEDQPLVDHKLKGMWHLCPHLVPDSHE